MTTELKNNYGYLHVAAEIVKAIIKDETAKTTGDVNLAALLEKNPVSLNKTLALLIDAGIVRKIEGSNSHEVTWKGFQFSSLYELADIRGKSTNELAKIALLSFF